MNRIYCTAHENPTFSFPRFVWVHRVKAYLVFSQELYACQTLEGKSKCDIISVLVSTIRVHPFP